MLMLVDGDSLLHRAFHTPSYKELTHNCQPDGHPTGAIYGFFKMLSVLLGTYRPSHLAVAFDVSRESFRTKLYPGYKGNRPMTASELYPQKTAVKEVLTGMRVPYIEVPMYEADDIIATHAEWCHCHGLEVKVVTADRDLLQVIDDRVSVLITVKGVSDIAEITMENVKEFYGVMPSQVPDYKALTGDASDNIPGVPGIGKKTAASLLEQWGCLENILHLARGGTLVGKVASIGHYRDEALLWKQIATVNRKVPNVLTQKYMVYEPDLDMAYCLLYGYGISKVKFPA